MKFQLPTEQIKLTSHSTDNKVKNRVVINHDKGVVFWTIDSIAANEHLKLSMILELQNGVLLTDLSKLILCFKFKIPGFTTSGTRLLKADFVGIQDKEWNKYTNISSEAGHFEVHLN